MACTSEHGREEYVHAFDFDQMAEDELSTAIVTAVSRTIGVEPTDLTESLYDTVDANQIDRTLAPSDDADPNGPFVMFTYYQCRISVWYDGTIVVREPTPSTPEADDVT